MFTNATLNRLNAHLIAEGECWIWTGSRDSDGYGHVRVGGVLKKVHRFVYETLHGPTSEHVHHACRTLACCRPEHLELVDPVAHGQLHGVEARGVRKTALICAVHGSEKVPREQGGGYVKLVCRECVADQQRRRRARMSETLGSVEDEDAVRGSDPSRGRIA